MDEVKRQDYVTALMDSALVTDWDKLSPKVCELNLRML